MIQGAPNHHGDFGPGKYQWPFEENDTVAKFTNKEENQGHKTSPFKEIWAVEHDKLVRNIDSRRRASLDKVKTGSGVYIEYSMSAYLGRQADPANGRKAFSPSCTLQLLSVGLLGEPIDFEGFRKKRRLAN
jgi:hypothetical protein